MTMIWERTVRGKDRKAPPDVLNAAEAFIWQGRESILQIAGHVDTAWGHRGRSMLAWSPKIAEI
ncbi:MAG: hypothetical protein F4X12_13090 [Acidobacteriia bacterium]|nr:hypothetical protein [Terriglobia bacterium]